MNTCLSCMAIRAHLALASRHTHAHTHTRAWKNTCTHARTHTHMHKQIYSQTQTYKHNVGTLSMYNYTQPQVLYDAMRQRLGGAADDAYFHRVGLLCNFFQRSSPTQQGLPWRHIPAPVVMFSCQSCHLCLQPSPLKIQDTDCSQHRKASTNFHELMCPSHYTFGACLQELQARLGSHHMQVRLIVQIFIVPRLLPNSLSAYDKQHKRGQYLIC